MEQSTNKQIRAAAVAHALAGAVRKGDVDPIDASRILRHELRRLNTNRSHLLKIRSDGAEASIAKYAPERPPRNGSDDALHADHVYPFKAELFSDVTTLEGWLRELGRLSLVVCVTAKENFALQQVERAGNYGPAKYAAAGVTFAKPLPW